MKFLRRKNGGKSVADGFDDYVEPFPPPRRVHLEDTPTPEAEPDEDETQWADGSPGDPSGGFASRSDGGMRAPLETGEMDEFDYLDEHEDDAMNDAPIFPGAEPSARHGMTDAPPQPSRPRRPSPDQAEEMRQTMMNRYLSEPARPASAAQLDNGGVPAPSDREQENRAAPAFAAPPPAAGRAGAHTGRAKTRLLGFGQPAEATSNPFEGGEGEAPVARDEPRFFPVGWLVVTDGPGRGAHFTLFSGVSQIGRGTDQTVRLDFGDNAISRSGHALLAFDEEQGKFFLGSGGKANIVRLNGQPLLSTEELSHDDVIRLGETTLRFVSFCGPHFSWTPGEPDAERF